MHMLSACWREYSLAACIPFTVSNMMIPRGMIILVAMLAVGFLLSMFGTIREKSRQPKYVKVGDVRSYPSPNKNGGTHAAVALEESAVASYQDSAAINYALLPQQNRDVTYCVIDSRLVDDESR